MPAKEVREGGSGCSSRWTGQTCTSCDRLKHVWQFGAGPLEEYMIALAHLNCTGKGSYTGILFLSIGNENIRVCRVLELGSGVARVLVKF